MITFRVVKGLSCLLLGEDSTYSEASRSLLIKATCGGWTWSGIAVARDVLMCAKVGAHAVCVEIVRFTVGPAYVTTLRLLIVSAA